jgi:tetratricopeptide (TPR) repeat protein
MISTICTSDPHDSSRVYRGMARGLGALLLCAAVACGGGKKGTTTPTGAGTGSAAQSGDQSMNDTGPNGDLANGGGGGAGNGGGVADNGGGGSNGGGTQTQPAPPPEPPIVFPNQDPDPAQVKTQVDAHLTVAKSMLAAQTPDADGALREAREALKLDASNVEAAAYVAFAYYHKKLYDTAELVLDDVFKRETAKSNAMIYYVYGLVYDHTNRPDQAMLAFKKAVELDPNHASALVNLGAHQLQNKQYGEAQQTFEKLTQGMGRTDAVTLTSLGSAYRGRSGEYPPGSADRNQLVMQAEGAYKRALQANGNYGPAYYNLALLYLDSDPFPSGGGNLDTMVRLQAAQTYFNQYKNMPNVDMKLFDERMKDVGKQIKREEKKRKKAGGSK